MPFLDWVNKNQALGVVKEIPYHLLQSEAVYGEDSENLLIQGDNLLALKALRPLYEGQIKCVFIDPPYNTKSSFKHYDDKLEHSQWLSMMYPRLSLIRDLLSENGSLWISIDDDESHYLKVICDEVFGRQNFISNVIWEKKYSPSNDAKWLSDGHDHILVYAKNKSIWRPNLLPRTEKQDKYYKYDDKDGRGLWRSDNVLVKSFSKSGVFAIVNPNTGKEHWPPEGSCYRFSEDSAKLYLAENRFYFGKDGKGAPQLKRFLSEVKQGVTALTIWKREEVDDNQEAKKEVKEFNSTDVFDTPKPERLMQKILTLATNPGDFVLDSFLGSGTTAAVAHKMNRKWIGIEMGDHAKTHCVPRLQKVIEGEQGGISQTVSWEGGGGFHFCKLASPMFDENGQINGQVRFKNLAHFLWNYETKTPAPKKYDTPLLGIHNGVAYYLLYNGILGDKRPEGGNVLTGAVLKAINEIIPYDGPKVVYGEACRLSQNRLDLAQITFKQIPYDISTI